MVRISCIMSNYNTEAKILKLSIDSILSQTFEDFELIIIDDCSTDNSSLSEIKKYENNSKVKLIYNEKNMGLAASLNKGIEISKGKYIARMDTDDIAHSDRFEIEYKYLEKHSEIDICSSYAHTFQDDYGLKCFTPFYKNKYCKCSIFFSTCLCHPAVMMRKSFLDKYKLRYDESFYCSQDFDLWARCNTVGNIEVINKVLLEYRVHDKQISISKQIKQKEMASKVLKMQLEPFDIDYTNEEFDLQLILAGINEFEIDKLDALIKWVKKLIAINKIKKIYDTKYFVIILKNRVFNIFFKSNINMIIKIYKLFCTPFFWNFYNVYSICYRIVYMILHNYILWKEE